MSEPTPPPIAHASAALRADAATLARSAGRQTDSADRRTTLAADRTVLAAERTYAAWVRTGLGALASGVGARTLFIRVLPAWFGGLTGSMLIVFSIFCFAAAVWRDIHPGTEPPEPNVRQLPAAVLLVVNGFLIVVDLAALVGIWIARA